MLPKACIIGDPVAHSRSPIIHNYWLKQLDLQGVYQHAHVSAAELPSFVQNMRSQGIIGGNCTIPHKEAILPLCDHVSDIAKALGAVNTIWFEGNKLYGDNTDVIGFLAALDHAAPSWDKNINHAVVIGAGGAARAILYGLVQRGVHNICVVNRDLARAEILTKQFGGKAVNLNQLNHILNGADLLINTTSLGMKGQPSLELDLSSMRDNAIVDDIVYVPMETDLLKAARQRNLRIIGGLDMLLYQAVPGFERWFGIKPVVTDTLRELIRHDIERGA